MYRTPIAPPTGFCSIKNFATAKRGAEYGHALNHYSYVACGQRHKKSQGGGHTSTRTLTTSPTSIRSHSYPRGTNDARVCSLAFKSRAYKFAAVEWSRVKSGSLVVPLSAGMGTEHSADLRLKAGLRTHIECHWAHAAPLAGLISGRVEYKLHAIGIGSSNRAASGPRFEI